jgi:hypothetical protein
MLSAAFLSLGLAACGDSATSVTTTGTGHRTQLLSILEADGAIDDDPTQLFATAKALGVQVVRYNVLWSGYAPHATSRTEPAGFDASNPGSAGYLWGPLDGVVEAAHAAGIRLYLTLTSPAPLWATGRDPVDCTAPCESWKPSATQFGDFVTAVGRRYSGHYTPAGASSPLPRISFWSLWNEPNFGSWLKPQTEPVAGTSDYADTAASQYRALVNAGWRALAATGHSPATDTILIGETAPAGELDPRIGQMTPAQQFVRDLYCVSSSDTPLTGSIATDEGCPTNGAHSGFKADNPALFEASGWADHPYDYVVPPTEVEGSGAVAAGYADFARIPELVRTLDAAAAAWGEDPKLPIYSTEYGYFTKPPATYEALPLATVAKWMNWTEYLTWKNPRIASYDQYLIDDPPPFKISGSNFDSGVAFSTGKPKPEVYDAYRLPLWLPRTTASPAKALTVWGCARPVAATSTASRTVDIQFAAAGAAFKTLKTVTLTPLTHGCYFDTSVRFPASGHVRLAYTDGSSVVTSRLQAITVG